MLVSTQRGMESYYGQTPEGRERLAARAVGRSEAADSHYKNLLNAFGSFSRTVSTFPCSSKEPMARSRPLRCTIYSPGLLETRSSAIFRPKIAWNSTPSTRHVLRGVLWPNSDRLRLTCCNYQTYPARS